MSKTREFNGWNFKLSYAYGYGLSKRGAQEKAEKLKKQGCKYRITYHQRSGCYEVWSRCR